ncbi:MAG TPA: response regulator [Candidatus Treponema faecavium]|nr:response regulator [Candidatus Treponema faecavium]
MSDWILVVDDNTENLKMASRILTAEHMRVSCLKSGADAIAFLHENIPDLILLDIHMPGMNGFETIEALRADADIPAIPYIFLTADEDSETETKALKAGAMDFIKKPFVPEVLLLRVRHSIDLIRLQSNLAQEVAKKTEEIEAHNKKLNRISIQIVTALSSAIDAKDTYTNGHSRRVAQYAQAIAYRAGFDTAMQDDIFMMGLLHDVGKIGIPDAIINKPDKLTPEEYAIIKTHPAVGYDILKNIPDFLKLSTGARWHHERYSGGGYPDGISGDDIPIEARIIAVADAYDAMSSRRSYRGMMTQAQIREEMEKGKNTQFDPDFAAIMIELIAQDTNFLMREI